MTTTLHVFGAALVIATLSACGGQVEGNRSGAGPLGGVDHPNPDSGVASTADSGPSTPSPPHEGCGYPPGAIHPAPTEADFRTMFSRQWLSCGDPKITHTADEAGFQAHPDGTYEVLAFDANKNLVPSGNGGTYSLIANAPDSWQVDFTGAAGALKVSQLTDSPRMLVMNEMGVFYYHYVPVDPTGWPEGSGSQPAPLGTWTPPASCLGAANATVHSGPEAWDSLVVGTWLLCSGDGVGPANPAQAGVQIDPDGYYHVLMVDVSGALVAATDISDAGTWSTQANVAPAFQLTFARDDAMYMGVITTVMDGPRMLQMITGGGPVYSYILAN